MMNFCYRPLEGEWLCRRKKGCLFALTLQSWSGRSQWKKAQITSSGVTLYYWQSSWGKQDGQKERAREEKDF